jgi:hypothetical protein
MFHGRMDPTKFAPTIVLRDHELSDADEVVARTKHSRSIRVASKDQFGGGRGKDYATHKHPKVKSWLRQPRFHVRFTPTSSSWLNLVER